MVDLVHTESGFHVLTLRKGIEPRLYALTRHLVSPIRAAPPEARATPTFASLRLAKALNLRTYSLRHVRTGTSRATHRPAPSTGPNTVSVLTPHARRGTHPASRRWLRSPTPCKAPRRFHRCDALPRKASVRLSSDPYGKGPGRQIHTEPDQRLQQESYH